MNKIDYAAQLIIELWFGYINFVTAIFVYPWTLQDHLQLCIKATMERSRAYTKMVEQDCGVRSLGELCFEFDIDANHALFCFQEDLWQRNRDEEVAKRCNFSGGAFEGFTHGLLFVLFSGLLIRGTIMLIPIICGKIMKIVSWAWYFAKVSADGAWNAMEVSQKQKKRVTFKEDDEPQKMVYVKLNSDEEIKESILPQSDPVPVDKFPKFVVTIVNGRDEIIGMGCRIGDNLITSMHVVSGHKANGIAVVNQETGRKYVIVKAYGGGDEEPFPEVLCVEGMDLVGIPLPSGAWAGLGVSTVKPKTAKRNSSFKMYGYYKGAKYMSIGTTGEAHPEGENRIMHNASSVRGWSGTCLIANGSVIGVHKSTSADGQANFFVPLGPLCVKETLETSGEIYYESDDDAWTQSSSTSQLNSYNDTNWRTTQAKAQMKSLSQAAEMAYGPLRGPKEKKEKPILIIKANTVPVNPIKGKLWADMVDETVTEDFQKRTEESGLPKEITLSGENQKSIKVEKTPLSEPSEQLSEADLQKSKHEQLSQAYVDIMLELKEQAEERKTFEGFFKELAEHCIKLETTILNMEEKNLKRVVDLKTLEAPEQSVPISKKQAKKAKLLEQSKPTSATPVPSKP